MFPRLPKHSHDKPQRQAVRGSKSIFVGVALSIAICGMPAAVFAGVETNPGLAKLEVKFFQHDYAKEDDAETRLQRLEKLVYGEAKSGDQESRLNNLLSTVTNLDPNADADAPQTAQNSASNDSSSGAAPARDNGRRTASRSSDQNAVQREQQIEDSSSYPQVSAMERKLLGHDYAGEPIAKRLDRLETKAFGKPSGMDDLSERVDRLKTRTGVDLAKTPPPGSDWADDEEDMPAKQGGGDIAFTPGTTTPYTSPPDEDGKTFSGRDLRQDMQKAFGRPATSSWGDSSGVINGGGGNYGMGGSSSGEMTRGGQYGYNPPRRIASANVPRTSGGIPHIGSPPRGDSGVPPVAPDVVHEHDAAPPAALGLSQQLSILENELFRKAYSSETIPVRLNRLESTVFPGQQRAVIGMSLPDRVRRLENAVPVSPETSRQVAQRPASSAADYDNGGMPKPAPQRSGMSKVINSLGNLVGGGGSYGAYPVGSNLVTDPQTGYLYDRSSGNLIDPRTGVVVGNRGGSSTGMGAGAPMGSYNGFSNGLSPMGSGYRSGGMGFGFGSGVGGGMMGGGMMGTGMGVGVWP